MIEYAQRMTEMDHDHEDSQHQHIVDWMTPRNATDQRFVDLVASLAGPLKRKLALRLVLLFPSNNYYSSTGMRALAVSHLLMSRQLLSTRETT
jgi:hypothetical protein